MRTAALLLLSCAAAASAREAASPVAGAAVSSREWKVRRGAEKEEEFIGDVHYKSADTSLRSDWALFKHGSQIWKARGSVRARRALSSGDAVEATGEEAVYNKLTEKGTLTSPNGISFERIPAEDGPDRGTAGRMSWRGREAMTLEGSVHFWGPRLECWSDRADYDQASGEVRLTGGRPVLRKLGPLTASADPAGDWTGAVKGDVVSAFENPRRVSADGKTHGWIEFPRRDGAAGRAR